jgi:hypothetical protein
LFAASRDIATLAAGWGVPLAPDFDHMLDTALFTTPTFYMILIITKTAR